MDVRLLDFIIFYSTHWKTLPDWKPRKKLSQFPEAL